ncbi:hypothetical protein GH714_000931 [Hevea brasiliensis]|uniref:Uncharacterized protein n=1 Tax=Hevea brasiliensis TaxID=3981 RepID=A0A6A6N8E0_HEVBR|nr:hypothetical protein GH714_000931 [Hevea brasiliensis]
MDSESAEASLESTNKTEREREISKSKRQHRSGNDQEDVPTHDEKDGSNQLPKSKRQRLDGYPINEDTDWLDGSANALNATIRQSKRLKFSELNFSDLLSAISRHETLECSFRSRVTSQAEKLDLDDNKQQASNKTCAEDSGLKNQLFKVKTFDLRGGAQEITPDHLLDPIFSMTWLPFCLMRDLLRLENQIPFFVLDSLFKLSILSSRNKGSQGTLSLTHLALKFFNYAVQSPDEVLEKHQDLTGKHLPDLLRSTFISPTQKPSKNSITSPFLQLIHSAKKLRLSGIRFKPRNQTESFLNIEFRHGFHRIPPLIVDDFMTDFFFNCVAFEQCYKHCLKDITSYVVFMGCLINAPADAGYLKDHRIIKNYSGTDDEVAKFFNDIGKDIAFDIRSSFFIKVVPGC